MFGCLGVWVFGCSGFRVEVFRCLGVKVLDVQGLGV